MRKLIVDDVITLVDFVAGKLSISKKESKRLVDARNVFVNGARVWMGKHKLMIGDRVEVVGANFHQEAEPTYELEILYQGGDALVINKPCGIECVNGKFHIEHQMRLTWPNARVVHRIDRDTSGCLLATTSEAAWDFFIEQFKGKEIEKRYLAILAGELRSDRVVVETPLEGKSAKTIFYRRSAAAGFTFCEIEILTGRTHQIRRHAQEINCSLLGDRRYGKQSVTKSLRDVPRQMLHAWRLGFQPGPGLDQIIVEAPIPRDFSNWQRRLRL